MPGSGEQAAANRRRYPKRRTAIVVVVLAVAFAGAGIWVYALHLPSGINPVKLQWWAGATAAAMSEVRPHSAMFRTALDWDLRALIPGYLIGLLLACGLGGRVFWASRFRVWARRGMVAVVLAGACNIAQGLLLLQARSNALWGTAILEAAEARSLGWVLGLLVAGFIGITAIAVTHHERAERGRRNRLLQ